MILTLLSMITSVLLNLEQLAYQKVYSFKKTTSHKSDTESAAPRQVQTFIFSLFFVCWKDDSNEPAVCLSNQELTIVLFLFV